MGTGTQGMSVLIPFSPHTHCSYCSPCADVAKMISVCVKLASRKKFFEMLNVEMVGLLMLTICCLLKIHPSYSFNFSCGFEVQF